LLAPLHCRPLQPRDPSRSASPPRRKGDAQSSGKPSPCHLAERKGSQAASPAGSGGRRGAREAPVSLFCFFRPSRAASQKATRAGLLLAGARAPKARPPQQQAVRACHAAAKASERSPLSLGARGQLAVLRRCPAARPSPCKLRLAYRGRFA